jgi:L-ribulose-5-phosphate 3-epimerase
MQGRMSATETGALQEFPRREWEVEFERAAVAGFASIQWLYDVYGEDVNPIASDDGIARIRELSREHGVAVDSLCAHYLVERPGDSRRLEWLVERCRAAGIARIVLPFLEGAEFDAALLERLATPGVELLVEGVAEAPAFNYDTGNDPLDAIGLNVRGVHLKDRDAAGKNVPLGEGAVDFRAVFAALDAVGYDGELVCETPRPAPGGEVALGRRQVEFLSTIRGR